MTKIIILLFVSYFEVKRIFVTLPSFNVS
ncbi:GntR family transcriptional regulator, partial [Acinetobacter baumannii]